MLTKTLQKTRAVLNSILTNSPQIPSKFTLEHASIVRTFGVIPIIIMRNSVANLTL